MGGPGRPRPDRREQHGTPGTPRYRTKVEVLRDVLTVVGSASTKNRIQRLANLNPIAFDHYLAVSVEAGLVERVGGRFLRTASGDAAISAIERVMRRAEELRSAIQQLGSCLGGEEPAAVVGTPALRFASMEAWEALRRRGVRSGGFQLSLLGPSPREENGVDLRSEPDLGSSPLANGRAAGAIEDSPSLPRGRRTR